MVIRNLIDVPVSRFAVLAELPPTATGDDIGKGFKTLGALTPRQAEGLRRHDV
jgi:hypothetical protein